MDQKQEKTKQLRSFGCVVSRESTGSQWPVIYHFTPAPKVIFVTPGSAVREQLARAQIPATGHYCFVGIVDTPLDPAPPTPAFGDIDDFYDFIRNSNNVTWRNFNVVDVPDVAEPIELPFLIRGAPKEILPMEIEIVKVLPPEAKVDLEVPPRLVADIPIPREHFKRLDARLARLPVGKPGLKRLHEVKLRRRAKYPSKLLVKLEKGTPPGNQYIAVRQVYKGKEVGRVTWMLRVKERKKKPPRVKEKR